MNRAGHPLMSTYPPFSGPAWRFHNRSAGTAYHGIVARPIIDSDIRPQRGPISNEQIRMCGIPQWALVVPVYMAPTVEYPTGVGSAWIKGTVLDELEWAMARVGAPEGPPEDGALIQITLRQVTSMGVDRVPANTAYHVDYRRPRDPFTERVAASINIERATVSEGSLECHSGQPLHFPAPLGGFEILPDPRPLTGYEQLKMTWRLTTAWRANNFDVF